MMRDSRVTVILLVGAAAVWSVAAALSALPPPPQPPQWMIDTIAGAEEGALARPTGIALARDGTLYAADSRNYRVVKLDADGALITVAGTGKRGYEEAAEGVPATEAAFKSVADIAVGPDGSLYIVDTVDERLRKVSPDGTITNVAGTGERRAPPAYFGGFGMPWHGIYGYPRYPWPASPPPPPAPPSQADGGPAAKASLGYPRGVALGTDGSLYIADSGFNRVRKIGPKGIITTIAGGDRSGYFGDGGPAIRAGLSNPSDVAVGPDGNIYIADTDNHRIRKITANGIITTVAGTGFEGYSSGGAFPGLATQAMLRSPQEIAVADDGTIYIADTGNHRVRRVDPKGRITTIAGTPWEGFAGDGGLAVMARLNEPRGIAVAPDGAIYVADTGNNRIRKLWLKRR